MKQDFTTDSWERVFDLAKSRTEIGMAIEKLRPIAAMLKVAMDSGDDNEAQTQYKRLRRSIKVALAAIFDRWGMNLDELLSVRQRK